MILHFPSVTYEKKIFANGVDFVGCTQMIRIKSTLNHPVVLLICYSAGFSQYNTNARLATLRVSEKSAD